MAEKKFSQNGADVNALDFGDSAVLPFSVEAEQSVLGSIIIDPKCYGYMVITKMAITTFTQ